MLANSQVFDTVTSEISKTESATAQTRVPESTSFGPRERMQPLVAWRSLKRLVEDPQRTDEVFVIIRALAGNSIDRGLARFKRLPLGRRVLLNKEELLTTLLDRNGLNAHPVGSLAQSYLGFITAGNLSADGLVDASEQDNAAGKETYESAEHKLYGERLRDQHDLWHTLTGYGRDELGEVCLLAFTYAQTRNRGIGVMALVGTVKTAEFYGRDVFGTVWRAYRDGKRAAWLPGQDWQTLLAQPLDDLRAKLLVNEPQHYSALLAAVPA